MSESELPLKTSSLKEIQKALGMTPKEMIKEWKTVPDNPSEEEKRTMLTAEDKEQIKNGVANGTMTY